MAPDALNEEEFKTLLEMIHRRYDKRIRQYENGEKSWEFCIATTVLISGTKERKEVEILIRIALNV